MIFSLQSLHNGYDMTSRLWDWRLQIRHQRKVQRQPSPPMDTRYQGKCTILSKLTTCRMKTKYTNLDSFVEINFYLRRKVRTCFHWCKHYTILYKYKFASLDVSISQSCTNTILIRNKCALYSFKVNQSLIIFWIESQKCIFA